MHRLRRHQPTSGSKRSLFDWIVAELADRVISNVAVTKSKTLADTTAAKAANHGVTILISKEISITTPYDIPKAWAAAWVSVGLDGGSIRRPVQHIVGASVLRTVRASGGIVRVNGQFTCARGNGGWYSRRRRPATVTIGEPPV